jgi:hypothetical protein
MVGGFSDRNELRKEAIEQLANFAAKRAAQNRADRSAGQRPE